MGKIFYIMGKSSSGKDTIYKMIRERMPELKTIVMYTTRPVREGEVDGETYHFTDQKNLDKFKDENKLIEHRAYNTIHGIWSYFTVDDGQFDLKHNNYIMIGTLVSFRQMKKYFGDDILIPVYIEVEDGVRIQRALDRERTQDHPKYAEMCRRFLADTDDFSEENLKEAGIEKRFENINIDNCLDSVVNYIKDHTVSFNSVVL